MSSSDLRPSASRWSEGQVFALLAESLEDGEPLPGETLEGFWRDPDESLRTMLAAFRARRRGLVERPGAADSKRGFPGQRMV
ncbi:MAG TPA: hypothetical protein PLS03_18085 [Terrimicrobiaceae bacterium]|nr:hypothetical protein [Terrimicrobiaceae bacterium]